MDNLLSLNRYFAQAYARSSRNSFQSWFDAGGLLPPKACKSTPWRPRARGYSAADRAIGACGSRRYLPCRVDAVDANEATIEIATQAKRGHGQISGGCAATRCTLRDDSGHRLMIWFAARPRAASLRRGQCDQLLRRCQELSHRFVLVADLERSFATSAGIWLVTALLYPDPMTKYDGRLSARRAFSWNELRDLAIAAGWQNFGQSRFCSAGRQSGFPSAISPAFPR